MKTTLHDFPSDIIALMDRWDCDLPERETLSSLLRVCFFASFETEEGVYPTFAAVLQKPQDKIRPDFMFRAPQPFTVSTVAKLAGSVDARQSSFGIWPHDDSLSIWGIHRHGSIAYTFRMGHFLLGGGPAMANEMPEAVRVVVHAPGRLDVGFGSSDRRSICLRGDHLSVPGLAAMSRQTPLSQAALKMCPDEPIVFGNLFTVITQKIAEKGGGGTLLLCADDHGEHLEIRHACEGGSTELKEAGMDLSSPARAVRFLVNPRGPNDLQGLVAANMQDAMDFVADVSNLDGAVVFTSGPTLQGFGTKIDWAATEEFQVTLATNLDGSGEDGTETLQQLGTRHRSAAWYCHHHPGSVAIVVSADGFVSCFHRESSAQHLTFWKHVSLNAVSFS